MDFSPEIEDAEYCFTGDNDPVGSGDVTVSGGSMGVCHRSHSFFSFGRDEDESEDEPDSSSSDEPDDIPETDSGTSSESPEEDLSSSDPEN